MRTTRTIIWVAFTMLAAGPILGEPTSGRAALAAGPTKQAGPTGGSGSTPVAVIIELGAPPIARSTGTAGSRAASDAARQRARVKAAMVQWENESRAHRGLGARGASSVVEREYAVVLNGFAATLEPETIQALKAHPDVRRIVPDGAVRAILDVSVPLIRAPAAWAASAYRGAGTTIAIVDTGVDYAHADLGGCLGSGCKVVGGHDFINGDTDPRDDQGHGTHVAATAAGNGALLGVAPEANILAYKVLDSSGSGSWSGVIAGIERATDPNGDGNPADHATIISMSLGGGGDEDDPVSQAVDSATAAGVLSVIAAGNDGDYFTIGSPGTARTALTVGATDDSDAIAFFSSRGPTTVAFLAKPDLTAPGVAICAATIPGGFPGNECRTGSYASISGTSMATPHVAGAAALVRGLHPSFSPAEVKAILKQSATPLSLDVVTGGAGRLDVRAALDVTTVITPPAIALGVNDGSESLWQRTSALSIRNLGTASRTYSVSIAAGAFPAGVTATVTPNSITVPAGSVGAVTLDVRVDNAVTPDSDAAPYVHAGAVVVTAGTERQSVVASFAKIAGASNDACVDAMEITTRTFQDSTSTAFATSEASDPITSCACGQNGRTVWYQFSATGSGTVTAETIGSAYDTVLAAFTGECGSLVPVGQCNDDSGGLQSVITFDVSAGQTYLVEVASYCGAPAGALEFTLTQDTDGGEGPANDSCATASSVSSLPYDDAVETTDADRDPSDPASACGCPTNGHSVWYRVPAAADGVLTANTAGSGFDTVLGVYSGSCGSLAPAGQCNDDTDDTLQSRVSFSVLAGVTYYVEVMSFCDGPGGPLQLSISEEASPAQPLSGKSLVVGDKVGKPEKRKVKLASADPRIEVAEPGSADDPRVSGAVLVLANPLTGESDLYALPADGWSSTENRGLVVSYRYQGATGPCAKVKVSAGKLQATCQGAAIGFSLDEPRQGALAVTFLSGESGYCMLFGGEVTRDVAAAGSTPGAFVARNAPAPDACAN